MRALSLLLVLLGTTTFVYAEECPSDEELFPCTCEEDESGDILVTCSDQEGSSDLQRLKEALNSLSEKQNVDLMLSDLKLGTVPSNFFYGIGVKRLEISHCELDSLSDDGRPALLGLENTLEELSIASSFTEDNAPAKLRVGHLKRLQSLDLSYNAITELDNDWFADRPASLERLVISNNFIAKIGDRAFANLINLKELSFDGNRLDIKRSIFPNPAQRLEKLELDNNAITNIPEDMLSNMPALKQVSFRTNGILRLDQRTWQPVWQQLKVLYLEGNPIECDSHMNWIFSLRRPAIFGKCRSPREFDGQSLQEFIDKRSRYQP